MHAPSQYYGFAPKIQPETKVNNLPRTSRNNSGDSVPRKSPRGLQKKQPSHFQYQRPGSSIKSECGNSRRRQPSEAGSNIRERIQKACKTFNTNDMKKEINLLRKEIERLEKEVLKKDQQIIDMRASVLPSKEARIEIEEAYEIIHFYEGKAKQFERHIEKFRVMILNSPPEGVTEQSLSLLFDDLRRDNDDLHANLQAALYHKEVVERKYQKLEANYFDIHRQLCQYRRKQASPLNYLRIQNETSHQKMNRVVHEIIENNRNQASSMESKEHQVLLRHYSNRLLKAQDDLTELREQLMEMENKYEKLLAENNILKIEVREKDEQNGEMFKKYALLRKSLREIDPTMTMAKLESKHSLMGTEKDLYRSAY